MGHGIVDVFAFQEALLIEAIFGIAILTMVWIGFRRWLQHKERVARITAEQTAERIAQYGARVEGVEARLDAIEQIVIDDNVRIAANALPDPTARSEDQSKPFERRHQTT